MNKGLSRSKSKNKVSREHKDYKEYVYTNEVQLDDRSKLVPLTDEDWKFNKMINERVQVGQVFKTYKDLCNYLGEVPKSGGNTKESQLARFYQHMDWENPINHKTKKPSKSFKIAKVFDTPRQRIDTRQQLQHFKEQQLECNFIFSILNNMNLHKEVSDFGYITAIKAKDMYKNIGLVNNNYYLMRSNKEAISEFLEVDIQSEIYRNMEEGNKRFTLGVLKRLKKAKVLVDYAYTYIWFDRNNKEYLATEEDVLTIENAIQKTIEFAKDEYGLVLKNVGSLYDNSIKGEKTQKCLQGYLADTIRERITNYAYYCRGYKVIYVENNMVNYVDKISSDLYVTTSQLSVIKMSSARSERTNIQCNKIDKWYSNDPIIHDKATRLQRVLTDNKPMNSLTDSDKQLVEDIKFLTKKAKVNEYLKVLSFNEDYDEISQVINEEIMVSEYEHQRITNMIIEATSYMFMPITLIKNEQEQQLKYIDLVKHVNKISSSPTSLYIECNHVEQEYLRLTMFVNYEKVNKTKTQDGKIKAHEKIALKVYNMRDIEKLQVYLFSQYGCKITVGRNKLRSSKSDLRLEEATA